MVVATAVPDADIVEVREEVPVRDAENDADGVREGQRVTEAVFVTDILAVMEPVLDRVGVTDGDSGGVG